MNLVHFLFHSSVNPTSTMRLFRLVFIVSTCLLIGCEESQVTPTAELPPATTTGQDTFGCYINGEPYAIFKTKFRERNISAAFATTGAIIVEAGNRNWKGRDTDISLLINPPFRSDSIYTLTKNFETNTATFSFGSENYPPHTLVNGWVYLSRWDREARIISGTFEFTMAKGADTVRVTEGRFDIDEVMF